MILICFFIDDTNQNKRQQQQIQQTSHQKEKDIAPTKIRDDTNKTIYVAPTKKRNVTPTESKDVATVKTRQQQSLKCKNNPTMLTLAFHLTLFQENKKSPRKQSEQKGRSSALLLRLSKYWFC